MTHDPANGGVYPKTRVWGSNEKILLHLRAVLLVSEKQHRGSPKCSCKMVVGSGVTYDYDAFGNLIHSTGTTPNNYLFAGEQFDPDLNLYYNRARYLNVTTGRFWTMDTEEGNDEEPLSLHKYLYTNANPVDGIDPTGNDDIAELSAGFSVSATLDSTPTLNATRVILSALPIPPYPASEAARQLVGAVYVESSTPATGGEFGNEKIAIAETFR
jgi:RHS repeat-associated protein